jgi:hypothetical protein
MGHVGRGTGANHLSATVHVRLRDGLVGHKACELRGQPDTHKDAQYHCSKRPRHMQSIHYVDTTLPFSKFTRETNPRCLGNCVSERFLFITLDFSQKPLSASDTMSQLPEKTGFRLTIRRSLAEAAFPLPKLDLEIFQEPHRNFTHALRCRQLCHLLSLRRDSQIALPA